MEFHGTDRFAHPEILEILCASVAPAALVAVPSSPTSACAVALPRLLKPHRAHMLYSAAASLLWLVHLQPVNTAAVRSAGNDCAKLLQAWTAVRAADHHARTVLEAAQNGDAQAAFDKLADLVRNAEQQRQRAPSH